MMKYLFIAGFFLIYSSCALIFMIPLSITSFTPEEEIVEDITSLSVSITFSAEVDSTKAELAFSLTEEGDRLEGSYTWAERSLRFTPYKPFKQGKSYTITLGQQVEDRYGNSLKEEFTHTFRTGSDTIRPVITALTPAHKAIVTDLFEPITVTFSETVNISSFYDAFTLNPQVDGIYTWDSAHTTCTFTPLSAYSWQNEYTITISESAADLEHNTLAEEHRTTFYVGEDTTPPVILSVENSSRSLILVRDAEEDPLYTVTQNWERDFSIRIEFSEAVDIQDFNGRILFDPPWNYTIDWNSLTTPTVATLQGAEPFTYETVYTLRLNAGIKDLYGNATTASEVYHYNVNGPLSAPPSITRITYLTQPAGPISSTLSPYDAIAFTSFTGQEGFFDIYIDLAQGAEIDLFSVMEAFFISDTNSCVSFVITKMETGTYTGLQPAPIPDTTINETVVRVYMNITDYPAKTGLITLTLSPDLADKQGNSMEAEWKRILVETP